MISLRKQKGLQGFAIMVEEDASTINNDNTPSIIIVQRYGMKDKQDIDVYY